MGDPRKQRAKFHGPQHPWQKERLEEEKVLVKEYGLKNKTEIYRVNSLMRKFLSQTKKLSALDTKQAEMETQQFLTRLKSLGIIGETTQLGDILNLGMKDIMERRLQTVVFRKGLARSMNQARQFITHGQMMVKGKKITAPSYLVSKEEESSIDFMSNSALSDPEHPERKIEEPEPKLKKAKKAEEKPVEEETPKEEAKPEEKKEEAPKDEPKAEEKKEEKPDVPKEKKEEKPAKEKKEEPKAEEKKEEKTDVPKEELKAEEKKEEVKE